MRIQEEGEEGRRDEVKVERKKHIGREIPSERAACSLAAQECVCTVCVSVHASASVRVCACVCVEQQDANWDTFPRMKQSQILNKILFISVFSLSLFYLCMNRSVHISMQIYLTATEVLRCFNVSAYVF